MKKLTFSILLSLYLTTCLCSSSYGFWPIIPPAPYRTISFDIKASPNPAVTKYRWFVAAGGIMLDNGVTSSLSVDTNAKAIPLLSKISVTIWGLDNSNNYIPPFVTSSVIVPAFEGTTQDLNLPRPDVQAIKFSKP